MCHCGSLRDKSSSRDEEVEDFDEVAIPDRREDPPWDVFGRILVLDEDEDVIPALEENWEPIPVPPPRSQLLEVIEGILQVSCQHCVCSLGRITSASSYRETIGMGSWGGQVSG